jgi:hypothetical protein
MVDPGSLRWHVDTVNLGTVSIREFKRRTTVSAKAGHSYLAPAAKAKGPK